MSNELVVVVVNDESKLKQSENELMRFLTQEFNQRKIEIKLISAEKFLEMDAADRPLWLATYPQDTTVTFLPLCRGFEFNNGVIRNIVQMIQAKPEFTDSTAVGIFPAARQTQLQIQNGLDTYLSMILADEETDFALKNKLVQRIARLDVNNHEEAFTLLKEILRQLPAKKSLQAMYNEQPVVETGLAKKAKNQIEDASSFVSSNTFNIAFALISAGTLISIDRSSSLALVYYGLYVLGASAVIGAKNALPQVSEKASYLAGAGVKRFLKYGDNVTGSFTTALNKYGLLADKLGNETEKTLHVLRTTISGLGDNFQNTSQLFMNEISALRISGLDQTQQLLDQITLTLKRGSDITEDNLRLLRDGLHQSFQDIRKDVNYRGERLTERLDQRMQSMENIVDRGVGLVVQAANVGARGVADGARDAGIGVRAAGEGVADGARKVGQAAEDGKLQPKAEAYGLGICTIL